ncbi:MAG: asparaginase domain-containing protein [Candidatus Daviesbacteria bacterium]|nr:asparaginase domain-containing protein [Candidatus Daviesbacteria bacterium]
MATEKIEFTTHTWGDWKRRTDSKRLRFGLIMTGGTIVSVPNEKGALAPAEHPEQLLKFAPHLLDEADFEIIPLMNLDSSNMRTVEWRRIASGVARRYNNYDGFLVTHGTDTMAYSATALRFALGEEIYNPVVFTGSQLPINQSRTDAISNLEDATATLIKARREQVSDVFIVADREVHRAVRSIKASEVRFDFISSPVTGPAGFSTASGISWAKPHDLDHVKPPRRGLELSPRFTQNRSGKFIGLWEEPEFRSGIITIKLEPNTGSETLRDLLLVDNPPYKAVVFTTHGAGNPPDWSLDVVAKLAQRRIPVIITPPESGMGTAIIYETARAAVELGAIQTGDMTPSASQVKLSWLLHRSPQDKVFEYIQKHLPRNLFGEVTASRR